MWWPLRFTWWTTGKDVWEFPDFFFDDISLSNKWFSTTIGIKLNLAERGLDDIYRRPGIS
jgi:hypothetical protein